MSVGLLSERGLNTKERLVAAIADRMPRAGADLAALVACRSVFDARIEDPAQCARAAELVRSLVAQAGVPAALELTPDGSSAVCGRVARPGAPRVLLYAHHDVVPVGDAAAWSSDPWTLTERDGRWYGRGAADCKGNLVAVLLALQALTDVVGEWPVEVAVVVEGSEEQSAGGMAKLAASRPDLVAADVIIMADTGNIDAGLPTLTTSLRGTGSVRITVRTMAHAAHSGTFGGAAPDALQALLTTLASLRSPSGETTIDGLDAGGVWPGAAYDLGRFREDAALLAGVDPVGEGAIGDLLWARPAATVLAIDAPPTARVTASVQGEASAIVNLRVPATMDPAVAQQRLVEHLRAHTPYGLVEIEPLTLGRGFAARTDGPAYAAIRAAMAAAYGREAVETGQGGSIPLTVALAELHPDAEIMLLGVEEPASRIHATDESVDPAEIARLALALALFLTGLTNLS
ncbi:MAG: M20/M25/M40 family metallo-hydrolase [Tetrasphaera jenkinsii]|nr:M20/M25/M40 family metallo-hydrolase [Tetrasphaera jenkinsii]